MVNNHPDFLCLTTIVPSTYLIFPALRIHLSETTRALLEQWGTFVVESRGEVELKGRGRMLTHWLLQCSEPEARLLTQGIAHHSHI